MRPRLDSARTSLRTLGEEPTYRLAAIVVVLLVALAGAALVVLWPRDSPEAPQLQRAPITVKRGLSTGSMLFGDTVTAEVDVVSDDRRVDPGSVRVETDFRPLDVVSTTVDRGRRGDVSLLRTVYVLRCSAVACLPPEDGRPIRFAAARIGYRLGGQAKVEEVPWRGLVVHSRLSGDPLAAEGITDVPPTLSRELPRSPTLLTALLAGFALVLGVVGALLVVQGLWPRFFYSLAWWRSLSPLSRSLLQVEAAATIDDEVVRRGALDRLAAQLDAAQSSDLGGEARRLAWGPVAPGPGELTGFVGRVRAEGRRSGR